MTQDFAPASSVGLDIAPTPLTDIAQPEGWNWLFNARKEHYFRNGRSLCGGWMIFSMNACVPSAPHKDEDACSMCRKKRAKELSV